MNKTLNLIVVFLALYPKLVSSRNVLEALSSKLSLTTSMLKEYNKNSSNAVTKMEDVADPKAKHYADLKNINALISTIKSKTKPEGRGSFGYVFKVEGVDYGHPEKPRSFGAKIIKFQNDADTESGLDDQNSLLNEIAVTNDLNAMDPKNLFFPRSYAFYDLTLDFYRENNRKQSKYFDVDSETNAAVVFMDFLDLSLDLYYQYVLKDKVHSLFLTRVKIFMNLTFGIMQMHPKYNHCDLKFANIMLKEISQEEAQQIQDELVEPLELLPNQQYQLQIIDFGMVAPGEPTTRRCEGGTPVTLPLEYFDDSISHEKFDMYSIAVMVISLEFASVHYSGFDSLLATANVLIKKSLQSSKPDLNVKKESQSEIKGYNFYKLGEHFWNKDSGLRPFFLEALSKYISSSVLKNIKKVNGNVDLKDLELIDLWSKQGTALIGISFAIADVYFNKYFKEKRVKKSISSFTKLKAHYEQKQAEATEDPEKAGKCAELTRYYQTMIDLENLEAQNKIDWVNYMLVIVSNPPEKRPAFSDMFGFIEETYDHVSQMYWAQYSFITMMNSNYEISKLKPTVNPDFTLEVQMDKQFNNQVLRKHVTPDFRMII